MFYFRELRHVLCRSRLVISYDHINNCEGFANSLMGFEQSYTAQQGEGVARWCASLFNCVVYLVLGLVLDLSWNAKTDYIVDRCNKKLWMIRRLKKMGADTVDFIDVYCKQIKSIL